MHITSDPFNTNELMGRKAELKLIFIELFFKQKESKVFKVT